MRLLFPFNKSWNHKQFSYHYSKVFRKIILGEFEIVSYNEEKHIEVESKYLDVMILYKKEIRFSKRSFDNKNNYLVERGLPFYLVMKWRADL